MLCPPEMVHYADVIHLPQYKRLKVLPDNMALLMIHTEIFIYRVPPLAKATQITSLPCSAPITLWHYDNSLQNDGTRFSRSIRIMHQWDGLPLAKGISCVLSLPTTNYLYMMTIPIPGSTSLEPVIAKTPLHRSSLRASSFRRFRGGWMEQDDPSAHTPAKVFIFGKRGPEGLESREVLFEGQLEGTAHVMMLVDEISGRLCFSKGRRDCFVHVWDFI